MSIPIIEVRGVSKKYQLGTIGATRLRDDLERFWHQATKKREKESASDFWALRDVSFTVQPGEVTGIIGRNGAGKSTLLKVLSRITEPTTGEVILRGRVASLLEVGTGFVGDLTGRENVFLNGAILGMTKEEIRSKFEEIIAFADIEKFIDTPVKRYSSGMYVRLAFAVAAHLDPEILIVDEVLAVGDAAFQKKCLKKLRDVSNGGKTVLFVSHQLTTVASLCTTGILLKAGSFVFKGSPAETIERYVGAGSSALGSWQPSETHKPRDGRFRFTNVRLLDRHKVQRGEFAFSAPIDFEVHSSVLAAIDGAQIAVRVTNGEGIPIFTTTNIDIDGVYKRIEAGDHKFTFSIPAKILVPGRYSVIVACHFPKGDYLDLIDDELSFVVHDESSNQELLRDGRLGVVNIALPWEISKI